MEGEKEGRIVFIPGKTLLFLFYRSSEIEDIQRFPCQGSSTRNEKQGKIELSESERSEEAM